VARDMELNWSMGERLRWMEKKSFHFHFCFFFCGKYRLVGPRGRGCVGHTPQIFRSSLSANPVHHQQLVPLAAGSSVRDDQLVSTIGKLTDVIGNLGTLITDNMSHNDRSTRVTT
jgi:hypothetical protein